MHHFNLVLEYLEAHLDADVDDTIRRLTGTTPYQFRYMFAYLANMSLAHYLLTQRLARANRQLLEGQRVLTVALAAGYSSADGFARAYQRWHGIWPSQVLPQRATKTAPPYRFELTIHGGMSMQYRIEQHPAMALIGVSARVPLQFEGVNPAIAALAQTITPAQRAAMHQLADLPPNGVIGADYDLDDQTAENTSLTHLIGVMSSHTDAVTDLTVVPVPAATWAIFSSKGPFPQTLQATWAAIVAQWLPDSGYALTALPQISYVNYQDPEANRYSEIWVAVEKAK